MESRYIGRFAPSPTGPLHGGSVLAAVGSWLDARAAGDRWLLRIENVDAGRCSAEAEAQIVAGLRTLGLEWDGPISRQSARLTVYESHLQALLGRGLAFHCACSRADLKAHAAGQAPRGEIPYPGTCRAGARATPRSVRLRVEPGCVHFRDRLLGQQQQEPSRQCGDFVLKRGDGLHAYQLAVVVDDWQEGITDVVRGHDLLDSTGRQILLQRALGAAQPRYAHLPLLLDAQGRKLSKQTGARAVDLKSPERALQRALRQLGQPPADGTLPEILSQAVRHWRLDAVSPQSQAPVAADGS